MFQKALTTNLLKLLANDLHLDLNITLPSVFIFTHFARASQIPGFSMNGPLCETWDNTLTFFCLYLPYLDCIQVHWFNPSLNGLCKGVFRISWWWWWSYGKIISCLKLIRNMLETWEWYVVPIHKYFTKIFIL